MGAVTTCSVRIAGVKAMILERHICLYALDRTTACRAAAHVDVSISRSNVNVEGPERTQPAVTRRGVHGDDADGDVGGEFE